MRDVLLFPFALCLVLLIRLFSVFRTVRIGFVDFARIGHSYLIDWHLSNVRFEKTKYIDLFFLGALTGKVANQYWFSLWKDKVAYFPMVKLFPLVEKINRSMPSYQKHEIPLEYYPFKTETYLKNVISNQQSFLAFSKNDELNGKKALRNLGVPEGKEFIAFHCRDSAYLKKFNPGVDWSYHDFRDSSIDNYALAMMKMTKRGFANVRVGSFVKDKMKERDGLKVVDYPFSDQCSDFMDVYLGAKCRFFVGTNSGYNIVPEIFRVPTVYCNWVHFEFFPRWVLNSVFITKKIKSLETGKYLSFREIVSSGLWRFGSTADQIPPGIEYIENTSEENLSAVDEMDLRLRHEWHETKEDLANQERFWSVFGGMHPRSPNLRVGSVFLRENQFLLS